MDKRVRRDAPSCRSKDIYVAPGQKHVESGSSLELKWKPECIKSDKFDTYLFSQMGDSVLPIHAWLGLRTSDGGMTVPLDPKWWGHKQNVTVNLQFVPRGSQPWETPYPLGSSWVLTANNSDSSSHVDISPTRQDPHITDYNEHSDGLSSGELAVSVVLPVVAVLCLIVAGFMWHRKRLERRAIARRERSMKYAGSSTAHSGVSMVHSPQNVDASVVPGYPVTVNEPGWTADGFAEKSDEFVGGEFGADTTDTLAQTAIQPQEQQEQHYGYNAADVPAGAADLADGNNVQAESDGHGGRRRRRKHGRRDRRSKQQTDWLKGMPDNPDEYNATEFPTRVQAPAPKPEPQVRMSDAAPRLAMLDMPYKDDDNASAISDVPVAYEIDRSFAKPERKPPPNVPPKAAHSTIKDERTAPVADSAEDSRNQRILSYLAGVRASSQTGENDGMVQPHPKSSQPKRRSTADSDMFEDAEDSLN